MLQVQPDNSRVRTAMRAMRIEGEGLQGLTREERILASLLRAGDILHPNMHDDIGWATYCPNVFSCPLLATCCHPGGRGFKSVAPANFPGVKNGRTLARYHDVTRARDPGAVRSVVRSEIGVSDSPGWSKATRRNSMRASREATSGWPPSPSGVGSAA